MRLLAISTRLAAALACVALSGCQGQIGPRDPGETPPPPGAVRPPSGACGAVPSPGPAPLRRLTRGEYDNTVRDLLGDRTGPANAFPPDDRTGVFDNEAEHQAVSPELARRYMEAAETLATTLAHNATGLFTLMGCDPARDGEATCVGRLIDELGRRAYRRPLRDTERTRLRALYDANRTGYDLANGVSAVAQAMLQSPHFLYRVELAGSTGVAPVGAYELASRLSYLLWGSMPDETLFQAAAAGTLGTPAQVAAQARRMLADPRARDRVADFHTQWLGLDDLSAAHPDPDRYPEFNDALAASMAAETRAFLDAVVFDGDGRLESLFTAPFTFVDAPLARLYGVTLPAGTTTTGLTRVALDPRQRAGILTQPSLLATYDRDELGPIFRGKLVRTRFLCQSLPSPPDNVPPPPPVRADQSTRDRLADHRRDASCASCHNLIDPIGLGFEHYDAIGRFRTQDGGSAVDARGEITAAADANGTFDGVPELAQRLARSETVRACVGLQWFRFAFGRAETPQDDCSVRAAQAAFAASGYDVRELLVALTQTDSFLYRPAATTTTGAMMEGSR